MAEVKIRRRARRDSGNAEKSSIGYLLSDAAYESLCVPGYTSLDRCPEVMTAVRKIAETISMMTIHIMENTEHGDKRIVNELSRKIDIAPCSYMTRKTWIEAVIMNLLLYGGGNSVVKVHTERGYLSDLEPIPASRVSFMPQKFGYSVFIDGIEFSPDEVLHFVHNPDPNYPWEGRGIKVSLRDVSNILKQSTATEKAFMESKWKPSVIVKVDALTEEFSSPKGRKKLLDSYVQSSEAGEPWLIPAEQFDIQQVKPLTLADLAISDTVKLSKQAVAAIIGVPSFLLGVGEYKKDAWNNFVNTTIKTICTGIQQEETKKLIMSPKWYIKFNYTSLLDWDLQTISAVFGGLSDRGFITGNEVRDKIGMSPLDGLDELRVLENYIPVEKSGSQKKLIQEGE